MAVIVGLGLSEVGMLLCVSVAMRVGAGVLLGVSVGGGTGAVAVQADTRNTNIGNTKNLFIPQHHKFDSSHSPNTLRVKSDCNRLCGSQRCLSARNF